MTARRRELRMYTTLHIGGDVEVRVQTLAEWDRVVVHLGYVGDAAVHLDRDGIALLESALDRARTELDAAQDEMAAAIEAEQTPTATADSPARVERMSA